MRSEMPRPAASSAALLMRKPEDSFSIDFASLLDVRERFRCALCASRLLLMRRPIVGPSLCGHGVGECVPEDADVGPGAWFPFRVRPTLGERHLLPFTDSTHGSV